MERGWVGRLDGDRVIHLAAQTLQSLWLGGGTAREHASYELGEVTIVVPVLYPPTVRLFDSEGCFAFANATAVLGPDAVIAGPPPLKLVPRLAAVIGAEGAIAGFSLLGEWRADQQPPPKDRDFGLVLGPAVVTSDELRPEGLDVSVRVDGSERLVGRATGFDWSAARAFAAQGTQLRAGDVLAGPGLGALGVAATGLVELEAAGIGVLRHGVA